MDQHRTTSSDTSPQPVLFSEAADGTGADAAQAAPSLPAGKPPLQRADRAQAEFHMVPLDAWLPEDHVARVVWDFVEHLDLSALLDKIRATEHRAGQPHIDPRLLLAVWLLATIEGLGSSRRLDKLCEHHLAYLWLLGGVSVNYHTLSDFRVGHGDSLDKVLSDSLASLLAEGLIPLKRTAQDGMRVRASAGTASLRSRARLPEFQDEARQHVRALKEEVHRDSGVAHRRQQAARERAARERAERLQRALQNREESEGHMEARQKGSSAKARASLSDPEAPKMKMPDGGFRPASNVQFASDDSGIIVGCEVTNQGTDAGLMEPMIAKIEENLGQAPQEHLADGGFSTLKDVEAVQSQHETKVDTPVKDEEKKRQAGEDPFAPRQGDSPALVAWRQQMGTGEGQAVYQHRGEIAEWVNARSRQRGLYPLTVRSRAKVYIVVLWQTLAPNLIHARTLRARPKP